MRWQSVWTCVALIVGIRPLGVPTVFALSAVVEVEETITTCAAPNNGAGPFWCYGAPLMVRFGGRVFASIMETGTEVPPLCNTRWRVFERPDSGRWRCVQRADAYREREPCPLAVLRSGSLFLSVNPLVKPSETNSGLCDPHLLRFDLARTGDAAGEIVRPVFAAGARFTEHSYRGFGVDGRRGELLPMNIDSATGRYYWSLCNHAGQWSARGTIAFPIRACYPQVALRDRAAHVLAIGDIVEPVKEWREYKFAKTQRTWDYVFRRLFYTWTPEIGAAEFAAPVELDTVDATAGHITNLDLWLGPEGAAHVLYLKTNIASALLRDRFFPGQPIVTSLEYAVLRQGQVAERRTLLRGGEGLDSPVPAYGRFHATRGDRLYIVYACRSDGRQGGRSAEMRIMPVEADSPDPPSIAIDFKEPFQPFFTATERGGSTPSPILDILGGGRNGSIRYGRVRIQE
ncbi:MAG: hypothetical protein N3D11_07395 [Candidatus Sumerlaeia bacterium]|nr:hypothetical protein [Candidatus Sumerlaeia bacterium]